MSDDNIIKGGPAPSGKPIHPRRTHRQRQLVQDAIKDLAKQFPVHQDSDIERLIQDCKAGINQVNSTLAAIAQAHRDTGRELDRTTFKEVAQTNYVQFLSKYNKDELHMLFTCVLSDLSVKEFI